MINDWEVMADQLLGMVKVKDNSKAIDNSLWRRFSRAEKLPNNQCKQIVPIAGALFPSTEIFVFIPFPKMGD